MLAHLFVCFLFVRPSWVRWFVTGHFSICWSVRWYHIFYLDFLRCHLNSPCPASFSSTPTPTPTTVRLESGRPLAVHTVRVPLSVPVRGPPRHDTGCCCSAFSAQALRSHTYTHASTRTHTYAPFRCTTRQFDSRSFVLSLPRSLVSFSHSSCPRSLRLHLAWYHMLSSYISISTSSPFSASSRLFTLLVRAPDISSSLSLSITCLLIYLSIYPHSHSHSPPARSCLCLFVFLFLFCRFWSICYLMLRTYLSLFTV